MTKWRWDINLDNLVGRDVVIETRDAVVREGRVSAFRYAGIIIADHAVAKKTTVNLPIALELNGDSGDTIDIARIERLQVR